MNKTLGLILLPFALALGSAAHAQQFPSRPITFVVPYAPGGTNDIIARAVAAKMTTNLGQSAFVENKPGASGNIGAAFVAKSAPDGYTVLVAPISLLAINKWVYKNLSFDSDKDFAPITNAGSVPNMLIAHPSVSASSVAQLIAFAKANPGKLNFASMGTGTTGHLSGELFKLMSGVNIVHVPYKGSGPALQDLIGGQVQLMFDNMPTAIKLAQSGKVKGLALTSTGRHPLAPEVPTLHASGLPGFDVTAWFGFVAPAATPRPIVDTLNAEIVKALRDPKVSGNLTALGVTIVANKPEEFRAYIAAESKKWKEVVEKSGAKLD
ncbi:MAG: tripartite tricarboxylate transporter substrate binding protein [Betaproteobacteria bacterium]|nr:tripartite tricarboxylate transporter substrate binding protein [Betaproteobacteria bacterium]